MLPGRRGTSVSGAPPAPARTLLSGKISGARTIVVAIFTIAVMLTLGAMRPIALATALAIAVVFAMRSFLPAMARRSDWRLDRRVRRTGRDLRFWSRWDS